MNGHVVLDGLVFRRVDHPLNRGLQVLLAIRASVQVRYADLLRHAARLAEVPLRVAHPRTRIDGVAHLLRRQFQPRDVDHLKPVDLLGRRPLAEIHHQFVVKELLLHVRQLAMEILCAQVQLAPRKVARRILAERDRALLAVHHLEGTVLFLHPVHDIQRKAAHDGRDDGVAFLLLVHELALVRWTDIEPPTIAAHARLGVVHVPLHQFADSDLVQFNRHGNRSFPFI